MARFDTSFDATSVEPTTAYELLPAGKYRAQIVESEMRVVMCVAMTSRRHRGERCYCGCGFLMLYPSRTVRGPLWQIIKSK
jgi:hypothetical protein